MAANEKHYQYKKNYIFVSSGSSPEAIATKMWDTVGHFIFC